MKLEIYNTMTDYKLNTTRKINAFSIMLSAFSIFRNVVSLILSGII